MFSPVFVRLSLSLVVLTCSILAVLDLLGFVPRASDPQAQARVQRVESLALQSLTAADRNDFESIRRLLEGAVERTEDLLSAGLRASNGRLLVATSQHSRTWDPDSDEGSTMTHARVPFVRKGKTWATIEVRFEDVRAPGFLANLWANPLIRLLVPVGAICFVVYLLYLKRSLRHLDPSAVIPTRVQAALDVMSEGVVLLDPNERIVLVNKAFADRMNRPSHALLGMKVSELGWLVPSSLKKARDLPWLEALQDAEIKPTTPLSIRMELDSVHTFMVNAAPVGDEKGKARGALATFNDITELEQNRRELERALDMLEKSRDEIRLQNDELQILARCDPLTGVANRRSFMEDGELEVARAMRDGQDLCCLMMDIDHFKRVNDEHGHTMGDEVIKLFATELVDGLDHFGLICRYGGEEFCVVLPGVDLTRAVTLAEKLRLAIASESFGPIPLSCSFGVASLASGATTLSDLLNQADEALYASKQAGRNRVTRWDELHSSVVSQSQHP